MFYICYFGLGLAAGTILSSLIKQILSLVLSQSAGLLRRMFTSCVAVSILLIRLCISPIYYTIIYLSLWSMLGHITNLLILSILLISTIIIKFLLTHVNFIPYCCAISLVFITTVIVSIFLTYAFVLLFIYLIIIIYIYRIIYDMYNYNIYIVIIRLNKSYFLFIIIMLSILIYVH